MSGDERQNWTHASDALADSLCGGRHFAQRNLPDVTSPDAATGNKVHAALADPKEVKWTQTMTATERDIFEACRELEKKKVTEFFGDTSAGIVGEERRMRVFREQRYWGSYETPLGRLGHSAKLDVLYRQAAKALIVEYKTLPGDVPDSPKNLQLRDQMVLAWGNLVTLEVVGVVVVQPLVTQDPQICIYTQSEREQAEKEMVERIIKSNDPKSERIAGHVQCKFCKAALHGKCPEYQRWSTQMMPAPVAPILELPMEQWTPSQRSQVLHALNALYKFGERFEVIIKAGLESDPDFCPGWRLKPGAVQEKITDAQKCFERFGLMGGSLEQFMATITVAKGKLKDALRLATGAKGKTLDKQFSDLLAGIIEQKQNAPSLVRSEENE